MTTVYTSLPLNTAQLQVGREIGRGAFSCVFTAEISGNIVAVKQLMLSPLSPQMRAIAQQSLRREAALLTHLRHPRIPQLYGHSFDDHAPWRLILEYVQGITLEQQLKWYHGVSFQHAIQIGIQLCDVLAYLHRQEPPIVYRDLKPQNIMLQATGDLVLIDFGQAWPAEYENVSLGTPGYAAPEQYSRIDVPGAACTASDVFSLGVLLHQLISGEKPKSISAEGWVEFSSLHGRTPPRLARLIAHMLQVEPMQRPVIWEVQQELEALSAAQTLHATAH